MCIAGARPNFVKIAPILKALQRVQAAISVQFIHTGQHYDSRLDTDFFKSLDIRQPDENLEVRSGTHAEQTATIIQRFEPILDRYKPDAILVVGDVNSTLACSLVAAKKGIAVIHVEAGLRSFDSRMPEEINRKLTDQISDLHFVTEASGRKHLVAEGIAPGKVHLVGNVMIDSLLKCLPNTRSISSILQEQKVDALPAEQYGVVTLHRPSNVDNAEVFENILQALTKISSNIPLVFPMHPRTLSKVKEFRLEQYFQNPQFIILGPLVYLDMLSLMQSAKIMLTDSGGIQEETSILNVPCLTLRENTERPITLDKGTNQLVGIQKQNIVHAANKVLEKPKMAQQTIPLWDGHAADRIVDILVPWLYERSHKIQREVAVA